MTNTGTEVIVTHGQQDHDSLFENEAATNEVLGTKNDASNKLIIGAGIVGLPLLLFIGILSLKGSGAKSEGSIHGSK